MAFCIGYLYTQKKYVLNLLDFAISTNHNKTLNSDQNKNGPQGATTA